MNDVLARVAGGWGLLLGAIAAVVGAGVGGGLYLSVSGAILGLVTALGICGALALVGSLMTKGSGAAAAATLVQAQAPAVTTAAVAPIAAARAASVAIASTLPTAAAIPAVKIEATETEAQLLAAGRFADYHLAKAKRYLGVKNFKEAAYQAAASLSHTDSAAAAEVRRLALAAAK